jgi:hypothetical protein
MRSARLLPSWIALGVAACGSSLPGPPLAPQAESAFVEVSAPPPPARVEVVPPAPSTARASWVDGAWEWEGSRWRWSDGGWFTVPAGVRYADWVARRRPDGTLLYANPQWVDVRGAPVEAPPRLAPVSTSVDGGRS